MGHEDVTQRKAFDKGDRKVSSRSIHIGIMLHWAGHCEKELYFHYYFSSMNENEISNIIIAEAIYIHRTLGPGLLESVYKQCLRYRLKFRGLTVKTEIAVPVIFEGIVMECGYRADMLVENSVLIELKCVDSICTIHVAQTLTYLKLLDKRLGLILNFKSQLMRQGIKRVVRNL